MNLKKRKRKKQWKQKLSKQLEQEQNQRNGHHPEGYQWAQNRQEEVKNSIGNGGAKELICTTHGHELRWEMQGGGGERGGKNWDNCNSTINKIHLKWRIH